MQENDVIVGLGSNIDPRPNMNKALQAIKDKFDTVACSDFVMTAPLGYKDQAHFLNGAVRFKTTLESDKLKKWLLEIENKFGRIRSENKNGPRTLDLDILVWNGRIVDPDVPERAFLQNAIEALWPGILGDQTGKKKHERIETNR